MNKIFVAALLAVASIVVLVVEWDKESEVQNDELEKPALDRRGGTGGGGGCKSHSAGGESGKPELKPLETLTQTPPQNEAENSSSN